MSNSRKDNEEFSGKQKAAIEIMVLNPDPAVHHNNKSVHENLWIKERFKKNNYLSIGVMLKKGTSELQFYFFEDCDKKPNPKFYSSLEELQNDLPLEKKDIFDRTHKVYLMGHGDAESKYGFGNYHAHDDFSHPPDDTEQIYGDDFDKLIKDILKNIHAQNDEIGITLEECHADNLVAAERVGYTQSFLERLSAKYPRVTFSGTGPWNDSKDLKESLATDARASGGYPKLNAPITSMGSSIWKHGNTVIFHHNGNQIVVRKSPFASTETAKNLKINTINYAREILNQNTELTDEDRSAILARICANRKILTIEDLKNRFGLLFETQAENVKTKQFVENEKIILKREQDTYLQRVQTILSKDTYSDRDVLMIALGLNHRYIFNGHDDVLQKVLANEDLLKLVMVSCGKVLLGAQSNNSVIDLLVQRGISINSVDDNGMTALHYAANNFYVYRREPLNLVKKLLECGANVEAVDKVEEGRTPLTLAAEQSRKSIVIGGESLLKLLQQKKEFELSILDHAVNSGRGANCFFQSFIHTLTTQPESVLADIQTKYPDSIRTFVDTFNTQLGITPPINFKEIINISRQLHPLERECLFGPILRHTYNGLVKKQLIEGPLVEDHPDAIILQDQTVKFSNVFGGEIRAFMNEKEFESAIRGGMDSGSQKRIRNESLNFEINGNQFYCDRPTQLFKKGKCFDINIVYANQHLNYTLGTRELNHQHTRQVIVERTQSKTGLFGVFAAGAVEKGSAPIARGGLTFPAIVNLVCSRFNLNSTNSQNLTDISAHKSTNKR